jgi:hypothetical protein
MKSRKLLMVGLVALFCTIGWVGRAQIKGADRPIWEYRAIYGQTVQGVLEFNQLGTDGWELAAVACNDNNQCSYFFKRRVR